MNIQDQLRNMVWAEKYRPNTIDAAILPERLKETVKSYVKSGKIPNLLFSGGPGSGKTTCAYAICNELDFDVLFINGSNEGRLIDTLRTKIHQFASTNSLDGKRKCILIDEFDNVGSDTQLAMRAAIDEYTKYCSFILTCNFPKKIIEPIMSRVSLVDFSASNEEKKALCVQFMKRVEEILTAENIEYDKKAIAAVIMKTFPDWRKCLNTLQGYAANGKIDSGVIASANKDVTELIDKIKDRDFAWVRTFVFSQPNPEIAALVRALDDALYARAAPQSVPESILIYAKYEDMFTRAVDPHITILAMLTELMASLEWR